VVTLYTREFFRLARSRLRAGGLLSYWLPIEQVSGEAARAVVGAFLEAFPDTVLLSGYRQSLILLGNAGPGPLRVDPTRLTRRVDTNPELAHDLERVWLTPLELIGSFAAPSETLRAATLGVTPVSDTNPALEYGAVFFEHDVRRSAALFAATAAEGWCPRCFEDEESPISAAELRAYLEAMQRYYESEDFLRGRPNRGPRPFPLTRREREQLARSRYLRHLAGFRSP
jgi:spermidine synthase